MKVRVASAEVQTLKPNGRPWDGLGGSAIPEAELPKFFALDLTQQLERLVATGDAPNPPDVAVRLLVGGKVLFETDANESFDPVWDESPEADIPPGTEVRVEVRDLDIAIHDMIGTTTFKIPGHPADGTLSLTGFGQVRTLVLHLE